MNQITFVSNHVTPALYQFKAPFVMNNIEGITLHNTQNKADALSEINYMITNQDEVSFHFACDEGTIVQGVPCDRNAWHAGDGETGQGNRNTIAIETCYSGDLVPPETTIDTSLEGRTSSPRFKQAEDNAIYLIALLLETFDLGLNDIYFHYDFSSKICPMSTIYDHSDLNYSIPQNQIGEKQIKDAEDAVIFLVNQKLVNLETPVPLPGSTDITVYRTLESGETIYYHWNESMWIDATVKGLRIIVGGIDYLFSSVGDSTMKEFTARFNRSGSLEGNYTFYTRDSLNMESYDTPDGTKVLKTLAPIYDKSDITTPWNSGTLFIYVSGDLSIKDYYIDRVFIIEDKQGNKVPFFKTDRNRFACIYQKTGQWYNEIFSENGTKYDVPLVLFQNTISVYSADDYDMLGYLPFSCFMAEEGKVYGNNTSSKMWQVQKYAYKNVEGNFVDEYAFFAEDFRDLCMYDETLEEWTNFEPIYDLSDPNTYWNIGTSFKFLGLAIDQGNGGVALEVSDLSGFRSNSREAAISTKYCIYNGGYIMVGSQTVKPSYYEVSFDVGTDGIMSMDGVLVTNDDLDITSVSTFAIDPPEYYKL